jgi:hypothetical protein
MIPVMEWRRGARSEVAEGEQRTQIELLESNEPVPVKEVILRLKAQLELCRKHYGASQWINMSRKIDTEDIPNIEIRICTDFSATGDLRASETDNCSEDSHLVIAVYVVLHTVRTVQVANISKKLNDCDVWYFLGSTLSKGKKNDHVFHNACLDSLIEHYHLRFKGRQLDRVVVWTDNCGGQYKCQQNFLKIATSPSGKRRIQVEHRFAQKYQFKGVWDAAGKVLKHWLVNFELVSARNREKK